MFSHDEAPMTLGAKIKVVGVGGAGGNAVNTMIQSELSGVEFIAANTDRQALENSLAPHTIQLGEKLTRGLGAGAKPDVGHQAAMESLSTVGELVEGADMVFVTAGMGGGTGTGAAPVIARAARETGALTIGVVSKPFKFEGRKRMRAAQAGLEELRKEVDTIIVVPNERLLAVAGEQMPVVEAFRHVDQVLHGAVKGVSDLINIDGYVNVDFADVRSVMFETGLALMGTGEATGDERAREAAEMAISSPLLEDASISGATGILVNITGGPGLTLQEMAAAMELIEDEADEEANIIFGCVVDESVGETVRVTVIATGFPDRTAESVLSGSNTKRKRAITENFESQSQTNVSAPRVSAPQTAAPVTAAPTRETAVATSYASATRSEMTGYTQSRQTRAHDLPARNTAAPSLRSGTSFDDIEGDER